MSGAITIVANNGISEPLNWINYPSAAYYNGKTYIVWQGTNLDPYISYYDHTAKTWATSKRVGDNPLVDDSHGAPSIVIDNRGYIHVFYGCHNSPVQHARSTNPENINSFTQLSNISDGLTYPKPILVGNYIYLFNRGIPNQTTEEYRIYNTITQTWSAGNTIIKSPNITDARTYAGHIKLNNNKIHITWCYDYGDERRNVFYAYLNLADSYSPHHMYTITGRDLGTTIESTEAETYTKVYTTVGWYTQPASMHIDPNGNPWIIFLDQASATVCNIYFTRWTGSAWITPIFITTIDDPWIERDFIIRSLTDATLYLTSTKRDIEKWNWNGTTWSKERIVLSQSVSGKPLNSPMVPFNFNSELELVFCQYLDENFTDNTLKVYAYFPGLDSVGSISCTTSPSGAAVSIDGVSLGEVTPVTVTGVSVGSHTITFRKSGYTDCTKNVVVTAGLTEPVSCTLTQTTCTPNWKCRQPLDGYEHDTNNCGEPDRLNSACNPSSNNATALLIAIAAIIAAYFVLNKEKKKKL